MLVALLGMTFNTGKHEKPFWGANIYLQRRLDSTSVFKAPPREVLWVLWLCRAFPFQWTHCIHICDQEKQRNLSGEGCDLMKGCLREDFFIPAEKAKSIRALHGSAHSQEWLACPSLPVGRPGKTNTSSFARINKPWSSLEVDRNWATFCYSYGRALVRTRICHPEVREFPRSQVLHWALYKLAVLGTCCTRSSKPPLFALEVPTFSSFSLNCLQMYTSFSLKDTSIPQLAQTLEWVDDLAVLSAFRVFCFSLPSAPFCPQWDVSAFS